jgi:hypothetical protein
MDEMPVRAGVPDAPDWMILEEVSNIVATAWRTAGPTALLEIVATSRIAARAEVKRLLTTPSASATANVLSTHNVMGVVNYFPVLVDVLGAAPGTAYVHHEPGSVLDALSVLGAAFKVTQLRAADLGVLSARLEFAAPQQREADPYLPAIARVQLVTRMLDEQKMELATADSDSGPTTAIADLGTANAGGYAKRFHASINILIANKQIMANVQELTELLGNLSAVDPARRVHPHQCLQRIFEMGHAPFLHALFGLKSNVPRLPVVKLIADLLRVRGPRWLGQIGFELLMPTSLAPLMTPGETSPRWKRHGRRS